MSRPARTVVLEQLRSIGATVNRTASEIGDLRRRVGSLEQHLANLQGDIANVHQRALLQT